jgi:hypothetical protein
MFPPGVSKKKTAAFPGSSSRNPASPFDCFKVPSLNDFGVEPPPFF